MLIFGFQPNCFRALDESPTNSSISVGLKIDLSISEDHVKEVKSTYNWNSEEEFERFMRFASRYANSLSYN